MNRSKRQPTCQNVLTLPLRRAAAVILLGTVIASAGPLPSRAILLTPPTEEGRFTLGATELWIRRELEWSKGSGPTDGKYNLGAIWVKYGIHRRLTIFAEFGLLNGDPHDTGYSRRYFNLGAGASALIFGIDDYYASGLVNYLEAFQHDNQEAGRHSVHRHFVALLQVGRAFELGSRHALTAWWGPAYVAEDGEEEEAGYPDARYASRNDFGAAAGADVLFWGRLECFAHVVFVDHFQPRLGLGYRF